jgi:antitoxin StbD
MSYEILSDMVASISELKKNPMNTFESAEGRPIAILNHNKPIFYCVSSELYAEMVERLEDIELTKIAIERLENAETIEVNINDL